MGKARSFGVTINPYSGLKDDLIEALKKSMNKSKTINYHESYIEKDGSDRHCHIQVWCDKPSNISDIKKFFERICEKHISDWHTKEGQKRVCIKTRYCHNDWVSNYCRDNKDKEDDYHEEMTMVLPENTDPYYPSEQEQQLFQMKSSSTDSTYSDWQAKYIMYRLGTKREPVAKSKEDVIEFLAWAMFEKKSIYVQQDNRKKREMVENLYYYIKGSGKIAQRSFRTKAENDKLDNEKYCEIQEEKSTPIDIPSSPSETSSTYYTQEYLDSLSFSEDEENI